MAKKNLEHPIENERRHVFSAPVSTAKSIPTGFYAKGNAVVFRSSLLLFGDDPVYEAPEEVLLYTADLKGGFGIIATSEDVAKVVAEALEEKRKQFLSNS